MSVSAGPLEPKTPIRTRKKKPQGRVEGIPVPATEAMIRHSRVAAWKHGLSARSVTVIEARAEQAENARPGSVAVLGAVIDAMQGGDSSGTDAIAAIGLTESIMTHREMIDTLRAQGLTIKEAVVDKDGRIVADRLLPHPLLDPTIKIAAQLGYTATDMQLTRKSRGEGAKDEAIAASLRRDLFLRGLDKSTQPAPPED